MKDFRAITLTGVEYTRYGEIPKFAEGLYGLGHDCYAWMVPNGSWGESNAGLIVGEGESLLVDTLWDVKFTRTMLQAMQPLIKEAPLKYVVNTHADGDHFWGNELVKGCEIITSRASLAEMLTTHPRSLLLLGRIGRLLSMIRLGGADKVGHWFQGMVAPYDFQQVTHTPATRTFEGELTLSLGGRDWQVGDKASGGEKNVPHSPTRPIAHSLVGGREVQLIEVGPTHTHGDLMVYVPDAKTLYSADILFIGSTPVMWAGPIENWIAALDRILAMDVEVIVPGHGPITDKAGVQEVKDYWQYVYTKVQSCYAAGMSARDAAYQIVLSAEFAQLPFATWNSPERMMTNAHTLYRHLAGRTDQPKIPELLNTMRKQALLAHELPDAQPAIMRKR